MHVRDLMTANPITVDPETPMLEARQRMLRERIRHLVVLDDARVVGIVTDRDVRLNLPSPATSLSVWEINYLLAGITVGGVMTTSVIVVDPDRPIAEAARIMIDHKIGALPVAEEGRLVGIITESDFVRAMAGSSHDRMTGMILVVDDERDLATTCERLLNRRGWNVIIAGSREAALTMLARQPPPVLAIVDRQLPDGDGVDVLRAALAVNTPVIVVTGYGSGATRRLALDEGAAGFLAKPFSARDLLQLVREIIGEGSDPGAVPANRPPAPDPPGSGIHS